MDMAIEHDVDLSIGDERLEGFDHLGGLGHWVVQVRRVPRKQTMG